MFFVRVLNQEAWHELLNPDAECIPVNIRGDSVKNFGSIHCALSFYRVATEDQVERVAIALAAARANLDDVAVCWVSDQAMNACTADHEIIIDDTVPGTTPDAEVNGWHVNFNGLNLGNLTQLVYTCVREGQTDTISKRRVPDMLKSGIDNARFRIDQLQPKVQEKLRPAAA